MAHDSMSPEVERKLMRRWRGGPSLGLDPVSRSQFGEIIDASRGSLAEESRPRPNPGEDLKRDQFSRATWVMIVIAGLVLGVAVTMLAAS